MVQRTEAPRACVIGTMDLVRPLGMAGIRCAVAARAAGDAGVPVPRSLRWALTCEAKSGMSLDDPVPVVRGALILLDRRLHRGRRRRVPE